MLLICQGILEIKKISIISLNKKCDNLKKIFLKNSLTPVRFSFTLFFYGLLLNKNSYEVALKLIPEPRTLATEF